MFDYAKSSCKVCKTMLIAIKYFNLCRFLPPSSLWLLKLFILCRNVPLLGGFRSSSLSYLIAIWPGRKTSPLAYTSILFELLLTLFQELIQNAEDAGASQVKFLHDKHSHGTERLHSDGLAKFQVRSLIPHFQNRGRMIVSHRCHMNAVCV